MPLTELRGVTVSSCAPDVAPLPDESALFLAVWSRRSNGQVDKRLAFGDGLSDSGREGGNPITTSFYHCRDV